MTIRQKITLSFVLTVAALLALFSLFIFLAYQQYRQSLMRSRLESRARTTELFLTDPARFRGTTVITLPDQYEALFDGQNNLLYSSAGSNDYVPSDEFLETVRRRGKIPFAYATSRWPAPKEGMASAFTRHGKTHVAFVTAYDLAGRRAGDGLLYLLLIGNGLMLVVIGLAGYAFSRRALRPFDQLIEQLDGAPTTAFTFRLRHGRRRPDEAAYLGEAFNRLLDRLQGLAESQQHFVAYASHELRTPLTAVRGLLELTLAYDRDLTAVRRSIDQAMQQVDKAIGLANALLQLAEVEGLQADLRREEINLADVVADAAQSVRRMYPHLPLNLELTPAFLDASQRVQFWGRPQLLLTALTNLADNAGKYSAGKPVALTVDYKPDSAVITVQDWGIGIPPTLLADVFLPLMRADNVGQVPGFGLGLTLARKISALHGGDIQVVSVLGEGTTVRLTLPAQPGTG